MYNTNTNTALKEIQRIFAAADEHLGKKRVDLRRKCRYIRAIYRVSGGYEIHGKAGTRFYMDYTQREAERLYNAAAREICAAS